MPNAFRWLGSGGQLPDNKSNRAIRERRRKKEREGTNGSLLKTCKREPTRDVYDLLTRLQTL